MFARPKNWISGGLWKPKNPHSLEHLKYLHSVLCKNQTVTEQNRGLLVETLRFISEILIWGDQNDSSVFDFFLEKNMLSFFLRFMRQKFGRFICVQLLQTLNILFENISNETSVYYLLSNNHINSIIVHKFDFSDEEVMAYYISFLKTLSLKLNKHTVHFFFNEHTNDFALYTEAIKFFNHPESMVRIAVRTITLNVYKVDDRSMLRFIRDKTAAPYFTNLVWFIGNHVLELDVCVRNDIDHSSRSRLSDLVAEHLDHLHYLNDILCLNIDALNEVLTDHLLNRLFIPLYVYSLTQKKHYLPHSNERPHVGSVVALFLLPQVFLIVHHAPLVRQLADIILNADESVSWTEASSDPQSLSAIRGFVKPVEPLARTLDQVRKIARKTKRPSKSEQAAAASREEVPDSSEASDSNSTFYDAPQEVPAQEDKVEGAVATEPAKERPVTEGEQELAETTTNSTDEEKLHQNLAIDTIEFSLANRPLLKAIFNALDCCDGDYEAMFVLCLLYAMGHNTGINQELLDEILMPSEKSETKYHYNIILVEKIIAILINSCQNGSQIRLATMELAILLLKTMVYKEAQCFLQDRHLASIEGAREEATLQLRNFYKVWEKSEEIFLDMFEDEYRELQLRPLNVEYLMMDESILLPPTGTPLTGINFNKRLPCGEVERARRAIRVFFYIRHLSLTLRSEQETQLPLTKIEECVSEGDVLDLNNSDLIACTVINKENKKERRFVVIDVLQLILVEPDSRRLGWGVVKFVGFLQDVEVSGDKEDSRSLHITIHKPATNVFAHPIPLLSARFVFDDHIRCMAAKQRLTKGRLRARQRKMQMIAKLLELPTHIVDSMYQPSSGSTMSAAMLRTSASTGAIPGRSHQVQRGASQSTESSAPHPPLQRTHSDGFHHRSIFSSIEGTTSFQAAREQAAGSGSRQLPRHLPRQAKSGGRSSARPGGASRQRPVQGSIQRVMEEAGVEVGTPALVDEAEEAIPSPEAHARQSLNPRLSPVPPKIEPQGRHSRSSSTDSNTSHGPQDIPMEDLSSRGQSPHKGQEQKTRSGSASPRRVRRGSGSSSPRGRPSGSSPSSAPEEPQSSPSKENGPTEEITSFMKDKNKTSKNKKQQSDSDRVRSRSGSANCPKSLSPAQEPALSLVQSCDMTPQSSPTHPAITSPQLLPPADPDQVRGRTEPPASDKQTANDQTPLTAKLPFKITSEPTLSESMISATGQQSSAPQTD